MALEVSLPDGWTVGTLEECVDILDNQRIPINADEREKRIAGKDKSQLYPYFGATGKVGWIDDFLFDGEILLLGEDGAPFLDKGKNKAYIVRGKSWVNNHAHVLRARNGITTNLFLMHYLNYFDYHGYVTGTTRLKLNQAHLRSFPVVLPPLPEQERIVAKIEALFTQLEAGTAALRRVHAGLKRYKASVLKAACEGRLVEQDPSEEPAEELVKRLSKTQFERETLPPLPVGWCWAILSEIGDISGGLTKNSNRRNMSLKLPYLRVANVYSNELRLDEVLEIGIEEREIQRVLLQKGDLLVVEGNGSADQIGRVAIWNGSISPCLHQNHIIKVRFKPMEIVNFVLYWFLSKRGREQINRVASSTSGLYTLSLSKVSNLLVPLPPLQEQQRIVSEVERHLSVANQVEAAVETGLKRAERQRQAILKRAFEGKLV